MPPKTFAKDGERKIEMGIILCKKHGKQGFSEVCGHIDTEYKQDICNKHRVFGLAEMFEMLVCNECWKHHNLDRFQTFSEMTENEFFDLEEERANQIVKEWSDVYNNVNRRGWCLQCVAEIKVKQARKNGEPDPFRVFEKTLTQLDQEKLDELERNLIANFEFQKSIYWETSYQSRPAISVRAGAYNYPLNIQIYYVISENEQDSIINFVSKFLSQTELNQAKIIFVESENWIATENQFGLFNYQRGEENILREVNLNC